MAHLCLTMKTRPVEGVRPVAKASREEKMTIKERRPRSPMPDVAGNGLLDRRALLGRGIMFAGATAAGAGASLTSAAAEPLKDDPWSLTMGAITPPRQEPSRFE